MGSEKSDDHVRIDARLSGQIQRYHTWPTIGSQTIAEHSWHLLRIYFAVEPNPDIHVIYEIVFHDIGETKTGDMPYPVKRDNPPLKEITDGLEARSRAEQMDYWGSFRQSLTSQKDHAFLKLLHLIEMFEFGLDQVTLGNAHGFIIADRCLKALYENKPSIRVGGYVKVRLRLWLEQCATAQNYDTGKEWWNYW